jgi:2-polyprenyl-6-methoxyphenol hydroxylase-like FAD-dependent oxidoreductase
MSTRQRVLIVGAGPAGIVIAYGLARAGAQVTLIDREPDVVASPRATVYLPSTLQALDELGLLADVKRLGFESHMFNMHFALTGRVGHMDHRLVADLTPYAYVLHLGQHELAHSVLRHFLALPDTKLRWNTTFDGLRQEGSAVEVQLSGLNGTTSEEFDWVIGADGARSCVRRAMGVTFDGFTWPETFMATNVFYDFESYGYAHSNMVADAANWRIVAKIDRRPQFWRIAYQEETKLSEDERVARIGERYKHFLPEPRDWQLDRANSYRVHQRSASNYRVGQVLLAGDAAHATNPIGGMGFTSGVQDASMLIRSFSALLQGQADEDVLDWYAYERRRCFLEIANPSAIEFKRRTQESSEARRLEDETNFFTMMNDREMSRSALMSIFAICGRAYRPDWRETLVAEDKARAAGGGTLVLGADVDRRVTREIE